MTTNRKILCLDFDGVLHSYSSGWKGPRVIPDPPVDGAIDFLVSAVDAFDVAIHSSRSRYWGGRRAMKRWLRWWLTEREWRSPGNEDYIAHCFTVSDYDEAISLNVDVTINKVRFPLWKPPAHVTIDDRAMAFTGVFPTIDELQSFKPWNRKEDNVGV